jgi:hypothetical protein
MNQNRVQGWNLVNTVMNLWIPQEGRELLVQVSDYQLLNYARFEVFTAVK